jgi:Fur family ferric uptake transcriptional regulator
VSSDDLTRLLERKGVRPTARRLAVLHELAREPDDATAQTLWRRLREGGDGSIGLATVYRTLSLLRDRGVVDTLSHHGSELCYRLCGESHHHHLVCTSCHRVVEVGECGLEPWVDDVAARHGFSAPKHRVEISGLCASCS